MDPVPPVSNPPQKINALVEKVKNVFKNNKKFLVPILMILVAIFGVFWALKSIGKDGVTLRQERWDKLVLDQKYAPDFTLTPTESRKYGIIPQETFVLKTKNPQDETFIRDNLVSSKPVTISKASDNEFKVVPDSPLGIEETIFLSMKNDKRYSWVFQTAPKFKIDGVLPRDQATDVPVNAGIEITFNNDSFNLTKGSVQVQPQFDFRIEKHNEISAIIPTNPLQPKTTYTVTVKKGFGLLTGANALTEDYTFSFQTGDLDINKGRLSLAENFQEIFPDEPLTAKVYASNKWDTNQTVNAEVYKFSSIDEFLSSRAKVDEADVSWISYYGESDMVNTKNMARVMTADLKVQAKDQLQYLQLPQNLNEGLYLVQFWFDNYKKVEQLWVQSGTLVGYVSVGKVQTAVWINSSKGENLDSSTIQVLGAGSTYSTNNEGWASFPTPEVFTDQAKHYLLITSTGGSKLVLPVGNLDHRDKPGAIIADDYWSYLYHERVLYKPTDTIYFWGVAKNRDSGSPPSTVDIYLGDTLKSTVSPTSDGSFVGKIVLENESVGYTSVNTKISGVTLASSYVQISNYVKPELKIEIEGNKKAIFAGESVDYKGRVTFFDGTPASNVRLYLSAGYSGNGTVDKSDATADRNGYITFKYQSKANSPTSYPSYEGVTASAIKSGEGLSDGSASVLVYGSKLQIKTESSQSGDQASLKINVNTLDLNLVNNQGKDSPVSGAAKNQKVQLTNSRIWYETVQNGTYYDFVEKTTKPTYDYKRHEDVVDSKDLYTNNEGRIQYDFKMEAQKSYEVRLTAVDDQNRPTEARSYFYYSDYQGNSNQASKANLNIERDNNYFSIGDNVSITLQKSGTLYQKNDKSRFLFVIANRGRQDVYVTSDPNLGLTFQENYIPNVYIGSIIFNGRYYEEVTSTCKSGWRCSGYDYYNSDYFFDPILLVYRSEDSKLDVSISQDKTKYQPGENARITVKVSKNQNPVSGASVQLTLVDEALAAIGGVNEPSLLTDLYKQVGNFIYFNYYSHRPVLPDGPQAERGGGGGGRDLFKDTAYFDVLATDANGEAVFDVKLPDNITNWLTYAQAMTQNVDAGQAESSVIATKDYFVTSQFPGTITLKDEAYVAASSFGNVLNQNIKLPIEAGFYKGEQLIAKNTTTIDAYKEGYFAFPKLAVGDYKVMVGGQYQNYQDAVTLPLKVITSRIDFKMLKNKVLDKGDVLKSFDGVNPAPGKPIKLLVTDEGKGKYYYDLYRYCYQNSNRLEKRIASIKADKILSERFKDSDCADYESDLTNFQNSDGGLKQVVWGESNLETTLWAVYVDPSQFNKELLIKYFENEGSFSQTTNAETSILRNWGLTLLGKPNINELNRLAMSATTFKEKILVALALYSAGNTERSRELYYTILDQYAYTNKPYLRIQSDPKKSDFGGYALDTSYTLLLGTLVGSDYNEGFGLYLRDYSWYAENVVMDIANISYLNVILAALPDKDTSVIFKSDLQAVTRNITKDGTLTLNLKEGEVNKFNLTVSEGKADASINYFATADEFSKLQTDSRLKLKKTVTKVKGASGGIKIGDILQVDLHYDFDGKAPMGCYALTDHIPSGMAYLDSPGNYDLNTGQKGILYPEKQGVVKGCAYNSYWWNHYTKNDSVYFVRVIGVGKFVMEPAIMQAAVDPSVFQKTSEEYITVEK